MLTAPMHSDNFKGIVAMLLAVGLFALMDACMRELAASLPPVQVAFLRGAASIPFLLLPTMLTRRWRALMPVNWALQFIRGVLTVIMLATFIYAIRLLSLADAYSIFLCAPLLLTALSVPLLGEHVGSRRWTAIVCGLAGVVVMLRPSTSQMVTLGGLAAFVSALCYALSAVTIRVLTRTDTTASMVCFAIIFMTIATGAYSLPDWVAVPRELWVWVLAIGVTGAGAQYLLTEAFRQAPASVIAPFEYTALLWGVLLDWTIWHIAPNAPMLAGGAIVVTSGIYLMFRERTVATPAEPRRPQES